MSPEPLRSLKSCNVGRVRSRKYREIRVQERLPDWLRDSNPNGSLRDIWWGQQSVRPVPVADTRSQPAAGRTRCVGHLLVSHRTPCVRHLGTQAGGLEGFSPLDAHPASALSGEEVWGAEESNLVWGVGLKGLCAVFTPEHLERGSGPERAARRSHRQPVACWHLLPIRPTAPCLSSTQLPGGWLGCR